MSQRKSHFKWRTLEMRKVGSKNGAFNLKWRDLYIHSTGWWFKNCPKSEIQVITEGSTLTHIMTQKPDNTTDSTRVKLMEN